MEVFPRDLGDTRAQAVFCYRLSSAGPARWLSISGSRGTWMAALVPDLGLQLQGHLHRPSRTFPSRQLKLGIAQRTFCDHGAGSACRWCPTSPEEADHKAQEGSHGKGTQILESQQMFTLIVILQLTIRLAKKRFGTFAFLLKQIS